MLSDGLSNTIGSPVLACRNASFFLLPVGPLYLSSFDQMTCELTRPDAFRVNRTLHGLNPWLSLRSNHGLKLANAFGVLWTNFNLRHYPPLRSLADFHTRARLVRSLRQPDFNVALVEDLVAISGSLLIVSRFQCATDSAYE